MTQIKNLTPAHFRCSLAASCPSLHQLEDGRLLVVGAVGDHEAYLTGAKQSRDEHAILIDPALLDVYVAEKVREALTQAAQHLREAAEMADVTQAKRSGTGSVSISPRTIEWREAAKEILTLLPPVSGGDLVQPTSASDGPQCDHPVVEWEWNPNSQVVEHKP